MLRDFSVMVVLALASFPSIALAQDTAATRREGISEVEGFHSGLIWATRELQKEFNELIPIGALFPESRELVEPEQRVAFVTDVLSRISDPMVRRAYQKEVTTISGALELRMSMRAWDLVQELLEYPIPPTPENFRGLLNREWFERTPDPPTEAYLVQKRRADQSGEAPLDRISFFGNYASRYLVWAALHSPKLWENPEGEGPRPEHSNFIQHLIEIGLTDRLLASAVLTAFAAPIAVPDGVQRPRTIAVGENYRGKVGFAVAHREFCERLLLGIEQHRSWGGEDPFEDVEVERLEGSGESRWEIIQFTPQGHMDEFLAAVHARILIELDPENLGGSMFGTMAEQVRYWEIFFDRAGVRTAWPRAKEWMLAGFAGDFRHPFDPRISELQERLAPLGGQALSELPQELRQDYEELQRLRSHKQRVANEVSASVLSMLVGLSAGGDSGWVASELLDVQSQHGSFRDEQGRPSRVSGTIFRGPWNSLALQDPLWAEDALRSHIGLDETGERQELSEFAVHATIGSLQSEAAERSNPRANQILVEVGRRGDDRERSVALANTLSFPEATARDLYQSAAEDFRASKGSRVRLGIAAAFILASRGVHYPEESQTWIRTELIRSLDQGLWKERSLVSPASARYFEWVVRAIPEADFQRLRDQEKLPAEILKARGG